MISDVTGVAVQYSDSRLESEEEFLVVASQSDKVRLLTSLSDQSRTRLHESGEPVVSDQPVLVPQIELRHWAKEQSISRMLHRHGRLIRPKMCQDLNAELGAKSQSAVGGQQQEEGEQYVNNH